MNPEALGALAILAGFVIVPVVIVAWIWALVDAAGKPVERWKAANQSKTAWLCIISGTWLLGVPFLGVLGGFLTGSLGALGYALFPRRALKRIAVPVPGGYRA